MCASTAKYSQFIATLQIRSLEVFLGEGCVATVLSGEVSVKCGAPGIPREDFTELPIWS